MNTHSWEVKFLYLLKKFPAFYRKQNFIIKFTSNFYIHVPNQII
jgi:hypothetical protein